MPATVIRQPWPPPIQQAKSFNVDGGRITQWFVPTSAGQDLDFARNDQCASEGILFLFFNPASSSPRINRRQMDSAAKHSVPPPPRHRQL